MSGTDLFAVEGNTSEYVTTYPNVPAAPNASPVIEIEPDRGRFVRLLNSLAKTDTLGMPVYMKLRDSNGDHIPANSVGYWSLKLSGMEEPVRVSQKRGNLSHYLANSITKQRNVDNIDSATWALREPETEGGDPVRSITVRDIDAMFFKIESSEAIDWDESEFYVDTDAVQEGGR
jgi:hypothetical protein